PYPEEPEALMAEIRRRDSVRDHMIKVAARVQTPAELRAALVADGTIPDKPVMEWYDRDGHYRDVKHAEWQPNLHKLHEQWPRCRTRSASPRRCRRPFGRAARPRPWPPAQRP